MLTRAIRKKSLGRGVPCAVVMQRTLRRSRAIPLKLCGKYRWGGGNMLIGSSTDGLYTKGTFANTHRELIREWLWEPNGGSLNYI